MLLSHYTARNGALREVEKDGKLVGRYIKLLKHNSYTTEGGVLQWEAQDTLAAGSWQLISVSYRDRGTPIGSHMLVYMGQHEQLGKAG